MRPSNPAQTTQNKLMINSGINIVPTGKKKLITPSEIANAKNIAPIIIFFILIGILFFLAFKFIPLKSDYINLLQYIFYYFNSCYHLKY